MKKFNIFYVVWDPTNKFFWKKNMHYGIGFNNREVFESRFTEDLMDATRMKKKDAIKVLKRFIDYDCIVGGTVKANVAALEVKQVGVSVELQIKPRWFP